MNRRNLFGVLGAGALSLVLGAGAVSAEDDVTVVAAGNGGVAEAEANGGYVVSYTVGANGVVSNYSQFDVIGAQALEWNVVADGGTAIADASGGDGNVAILDDDEDDE